MFQVLDQTFLPVSNAAFEMPACVACVARLARSARKQILVTLHMACDAHRHRRASPGAQELQCLQHLSSDPT